MTDFRDTGHWMDGDNLVIRKTQDVEPYLERNKARFNDGDGYSPTRDLKRVASIPMVIAEKWLREEGIDVLNPDHAQAVKRKLNSSEYLYLRTAAGQL